MIKFLTKLRGLSHVVRWNFQPHIRDENVAEHSFWVAIYALALATIMKRGEQFTQDVVLTALLHDAEEAITGDLPALVKRYCDWKPVVENAQTELFATVGPFKDIHSRAEHLDIIKAADLFAALAYANEEFEVFGNRAFQRIRGELIGSLVTLADKEQGELCAAIHGLLAAMGCKTYEALPRPADMSHF